MSLTAIEMKRLEDDARAMAANHSRGYLSDALQCLRETSDPIASLELLRAMWGASQAKRPDQKAALNEAGQWLEKRLDRDPGISPDRLALELGWLRRLVTVHGGTDDDDEARDDRRNRGRDEPTFGAHIDRLRQLRQKRARLEEDSRTVSRADASRRIDSPASDRPIRLPDSFEARFTLEPDVLDAFRAARKRRKEQKPVKDRLLPVRPAAAELQALASDLACSLLETKGMDELEARTMNDAGKLPSFWIAVADLVERDSKRVPRRISLAHAAQPVGDLPNDHR